MLPDCNRLKVFYLIYQEKGVANASTLLNVSQSAVSQQLKKLEEEIRSALFIRRHKRLIPTAEAHKLYMIVEPFFRELEQGLRSIRLTQEIPSGELRIGSAEEFGKTYIPRIIATFHKQYPDVCFSLHLGDTKRMLHLLDEGAIDFALIDEYLLQLMPADALTHYSREKVIDEEMILVGSKEYCESRMRGDFSLNTLARQDYISYHHEALALANWFKYHFKKPVKDLRVVLETKNLHAALNAMENHLGLTVVASHLILERIKQGELVPVLTKRKPIVNRISLAQIKGKDPSRAEAAFLSHFRTEIRRTDVLMDFSATFSAEAL